VSREEVPPGPANVTRREVARGAGLAGLARAGALIEALAQPVYIWMFGLATYGLYVVLWGVINLTTNIIDLSMTSALQRVVPGEDEEARAHGAVKFALLVSVLPASLLAAGATLYAEPIAGLLSAAPEDRASLPTAIALFAWALPLWTFVEVATSAARARRAFGPEIRLRILWEQLARLLFAAVFFGIGLRSLGLVSAHLASLALTAGLCLPLLARYYRLRLLLAAPIPRGLALNLLGTGLALLPSNLSRRLLIDAPPVLLNLMLPGARGAAAAGLFEIGRKISTVPHIVRQSFQYVLGPLSSAQARADRSAIGPLYHFASRVSAALVVPLAGFLIFIAADFLSLYRPEVAAALPLLVVLVVARAFEAIVGPAATIVEMTGHRALPLLNSLLAAGLWALLAFLLVPGLGELGMAMAVAAATVIAAYAATLELRLSDRLTPFDRTLFLAIAIAIACAGIAAMALLAQLPHPALRVPALVLAWAATSWLTLRHGLTIEDRQALGGLSRKLRLPL
jgi:O-antigen/teichoic acid export membrane protein